VGPVRVAEMAEAGETVGVAEAATVPAPGTAKPSPSRERRTGLPREQLSHGAPKSSRSSRPTLVFSRGSAIRSNFESKVANSPSQMPDFHLAFQRGNVRPAGQNPATRPQARRQDSLNASTPLPVSCTAKVRSPLRFRTGRGCGFSRVSPRESPVPRKTSPSLPRLSPQPEHGLTRPWFPPSRGPAHWACWVQSSTAGGWKRPRAPCKISAFGRSGGLAQLGERGVRNAEVEGSNPLPSTIPLTSNKSRT
jgi:hypothetical protein